MLSPQSKASLAQWGFFHELEYGPIMFYCLLICTYDFCLIRIALLCLLQTYPWLVGITHLGMSLAKIETHLENTVLTSKGRESSNNALVPVDKFTKSLTNQRPLTHILMI